MRPPLLPPHRALSVRRRLRRAEAVRQHLLTCGYQLVAGARGDTVFVAQSHGTYVPSDVAALIRRHHAALLALLQRTAECSAVLQHWGARAPATARLPYKRAACWHLPNNDRGT